MTVMEAEPELAQVVALPGVPQTPAAQPTRPDPLLGMTGRQKAAVLVLQLGKTESARVLGHLSESELEDLSADIARMGSVPPAVSAAVLAEFAGMLASGGATTRGGIELARELLLAAVGPARAEEMLDRLSQAFVELPFAFLQHLDARQVVSFLSDEHPQTIALVLAHLPAGPAAAVLAGLQAQLQADVAHRIAVMDRTSPDLIRKVESALERRLSSLGVASDLSAVGGVRPLVEIINRADRGTERMILDGLEQRDPALAEAVRGQMFMFEDLIGLEDRAIQLVLREVQINDLATALKGVPDNVRVRVQQNMSERAALTLAEEIEVLGPVRVHVVEEAQAAIVRVIRQLEESGQIVVGRGDEDEFVA
ncbi:MAG TPA: flagellar motor switch protein FliG [Jatrophihabitans sp.]|nr:flagellar motor switch protein FliG [Jatrophihabitans sp.]